MQKARRNVKIDLSGFPCMQIDQTYIVKPIEARPNLRVSYRNTSRGTGLCVDVKIYEWVGSNAHVMYYRRKDNFTLENFSEFIKKICGLNRIRQTFKGQNE